MYRELTGDLPGTDENKNHYNKAPNSVRTAPNTFARARVQVKQVGKVVKEFLLQGFLETKLNFLPAFTFRDIRGTKRISWNRRDYVQIHQSHCRPFPVSIVAQITMQVSVELERLSLMYREHGMPWMEKVMARLTLTIKALPHTIFLYKYWP